MAVIHNFDWEGIKALVTGASGFKGAWLSAILHQLRAEVHGVVNKRYHPESAHELMNLNHWITEVHHMDIADRQAVFELINTIRPDVVFHLAAMATVPASERDPTRAFQVNALAPTFILDACRKLGIGERVLICSTDHAPGPAPEADLPLSESYPLGRHGSPYDTSKGAGEMLVRSMYATYRRKGLPRTCITRGANFFGFGDVVERRVVPAFINKAFSAGFVPLTVRKTGRQFISVDDGISGYVLAVSKLGELPEATDGLGRPVVPTFHFSYETYPGSDRPFLRIEQLASMVAELTGTHVVEQPGCVDFAPGENSVQALSCAKTRWQIGWQPSRGFEQALKELVEFLRPMTTHQERVRLIHDAVEMAAERLVRNTATKEPVTV